MKVGKKTGTFEVADPDSLVSHRFAQPHHGQRSRRLGCGVCGIEAEAAMLGQASVRCSCRKWSLKAQGIERKRYRHRSVLTVTQCLRKQGVVGKFGKNARSWLDYLSRRGQATSGNLAPDSGATLGFFPGRWPRPSLSPDFRPAVGARRAGDCLSNRKGRFRTAMCPIRSSPNPRADLATGCLDGRAKRPTAASALLARRREGVLPRRSTAIQEAADARSAIPSRPQFRSRPLGDVVIAGDQLLHQHLHPSVLIGAPDWRDRLYALRQGLTAKPLGPDPRWRRAARGCRGNNSVIRGLTARSRHVAQPDRFAGTTSISNSGPAAGRDFESDQRQRLIASACSR